ncbi:PREDICTED: uncharacterized protein LOC105366139 [Ceratosolen solmsi marchali]|uniref:Uncharacterized protein LOC105366139 n=1 Tax=Ceratosolen solmsi marchali TaxID=326594 RepID=A0AAJ6YRA3_9HYME|nr:PREDICTED: uncharacterized protein LOC105366139 [Ceratosolen solmsi marchali]
MGQLPVTRVTPSPPFYHTGVDYAGPLTIKTWKGRGAKTHKAWICVFLCFATSAVHLEVVSDYTTDGFIAAYRRFSARRGIPHTLHSDCGTTFLGADKVIKKLLLQEITTLLTQIEAILNSRPLEPLSDDPEDCSGLTPGHFLIENSLTTLPEPSLKDVNVSHLIRWQFIQQQVGTMVFITREHLPPCKWPLAKVIKIHPGPDDLSRVVKLKTALQWYSLHYNGKTHP